MKRSLLLLTLPLLLPLCSSAAPVVITNAGLTYTQNFNSLANAPNNATAGTPWNDDSTLPGWWLYRAGQNGTPTGFAGSGYAYRVADGQVELSGGIFMSLGAAGSTERALGNPSTTAQGELSALLIFQNTGTISQELTGVRHNVEVLRTNQNASLTETEFVWWRTASSAAAIRSMTTAAATDVIFPASVAASPGSDYVTGWNRMREAEITYTGGAANTPVNESFPVNVSPASRIRLLPGQFFGIRYANINDIGRDHFMGIDDVQLTWTPVNVDMTLTVSGVVRQAHGTPLDFSDDTADFTLTVTAIGNPSPAGWTVVAPAFLAGQTGLYGQPKRFTGIPLSEFNGPGHTMDVSVADAGSPADADTVAVAAQWCRITPVVSNVVRDDRGTAELFDDLWSYTVTVGSEFAGPGWTSTSSLIPAGSYGTPYTVSGLSVNSPVDTIVFTDTVDPACTAASTAVVKRVVGTVDLGTPAPLFSDAAGVPEKWSVDEAGRFQSLGNSGLPAVSYRSEIVNLSATGAVKVTGRMVVNDESSGNEAADTFTAQVIIDGNTASPVSLVTFSDTSAVDGVLRGAELTPAAAGPPLVTGPGVYTHYFYALIPEAANSVQLVISGNNDSTSEKFTVEDMRVELAAPSLLAVPAPAALWNNQNTIDPTDDTFSQPVNIKAIQTPPASTGWTSTSAPASGAYAAANPVTFGPFLYSAGGQSFDIADSVDPSLHAAVSAAAPTPLLNVGFSGGSIFNNGDADYAVIRFLVSAPVGGPQFRVFADYPVETQADTTAMNAATATVTVTVSRIPDHGLVVFTFEDLSYPGSTDIIPVNFGNTTLTPFLLGFTDLGTPDVLLTLAGSSVPPDWQNYPEVPAVGMIDGSGPSALTSEILDLSGIDGRVLFTANLRVIDTGNGYEAADTFKAELILDGDTDHPVNLIAPYDANGNGLLNGGTGAAQDEFNPAKVEDGAYTSDFPLTFTIPDNVQSVQLIITGGNDAPDENLVFESAVFSLAPPEPTGDTDGDGVSDADEAIMGTDPASAESVTRLAQSAGAPGTFNFTGVNGRYYRLYQSDDSAPETHMSKWVDSGLPTISGEGAHSMSVTPAAGIFRRFYRLHVMQLDGPWPPAVPQ